MEAELSRGRRHLVLWPLPELKFAALDDCPVSLSLLSGHPRNAACPLSPGAPASPCDSTSPPVQQQPDVVFRPDSRTPRHQSDFFRPDSEAPFLTSAAFQEFPVCSVSRLSFVPSLVCPLMARPHSLEASGTTALPALLFLYLWHLSPVFHCRALMLLDSFSLKGTVTRKLFGG